MIFQEKYTELAREWTRKYAMWCDPEKEHFGKEEEQEHQHQQQQEFRKKRNPIDDNLKSLFSPQILPSHTTYPKQKSSWQTKQKINKQN
jgi:hypothetical protein